MWLKEYSHFFNYFSFIDKLKKSQIQSFILVKTLPLTLSIRSVAVRQSQNSLLRKEKSKNKLK